VYAAAVQAEAAVRRAALQVWQPGRPGPFCAPVRVSRWSGFWVHCCAGPRLLLHAYAIDQRHPAARHEHGLPRAREKQAVEGTAILFESPLTIAEKPRLRETRSA
jgi:hypothetical protein